MPTKYMAASVPRSIRMARLSYLPLNAVIGSRHSAQPLDIIMLTEKDFTRARMYLGTPNMGSIGLNRGGPAPVYVPQDTRSLDVPDDAADPQQFAKDYFIKAFGLIG